MRSVCRIETFAIGNGAGGHAGLAPRAPRVTTPAASSNYPQEFASTRNAGIALNNIMPHFVAALASL